MPFVEHTNSLRRYKQLLGMPNPTLQDCGSSPPIMRRLAEKTVPERTGSRHGRVAKRTGSRHSVCDPHGVYPCQRHDKWISIAVTTDAEWVALWGVMQHPDLAKDPQP